MTAGHSKTAAAPEPRAGVLNTDIYVQGRSEVNDVEQPIKLSSNESSFGPSPAAVEAYRGVVDTLNRYPDGSQRLLREAIAEVHGLDAEQIVCGAGSDELIQLATRAYVSPGDEVLMSENVFVMCRAYAQVQQADIVVAPERDYRVDVDALLARVSDKTRLLPIANPNNPTGTYITADELKRLHRGLPEQVLLLVDSAYAEYVVNTDYEAGVELVQRADNVLMTRTFSKIYGLPSLRVGWGYAASNIIDTLRHMRSPFNVSRAAMAAAAAAVRDQAYASMVREHNHRWLIKIAAVLGDLGLFVVPSAANFYLIRFPDGDDNNAGQAADFLLRKGIIPRPVSQADEQYLRITVGLDHENEAVLAALTEFMQQ